MEAYSCVSDVTFPTNVKEEHGTEDAFQEISNNRSVDTRSTVVTRSTKKNMDIKVVVTHPSNAECPWQSASPTSGDPSANTCLRKQQQQENEQEQPIFKNYISKKDIIKIEPETELRQVSEIWQDIADKDDQEGLSVRKQDCNSEWTQGQGPIKSEDVCLHEMKTMGLPVQIGQDKIPDAGINVGQPTETIAGQIPHSGNSSGFLCSDTSPSPSLKNKHSDTSNMAERNRQLEDIRREVLYTEVGKTCEDREMPTVQGTEDEIRRLQLSRILESSATQHHAFVYGKMESRLTEPDIARKIDTDTSKTNCMVAGDAEEGCYRKACFAQTDDRLCRGVDTVGHTLLLPQNTLQAGGDAVAASVISHMDGNPNPSDDAGNYCELDRSSKHDSKETQYKESSKKSEGAVLAVDAGMIPIKPIPALSYVPPDPCLMYQPEEGVMKSKPVPKPTRGRRARRPIDVSAGMGLPRPYINHPDMQMVEKSRYIPHRPYQRYPRPEASVGLSSPYYNTPCGQGGDYGAFHTDTAREAMEPSDIGGMASIASGTPSGRWYCPEDYFTLPRHTLYAPRRPRGTSNGRGRPRGRRGRGGVRQYLQHRLLWARYTGRSQEALDRVLTIINSRCGLKEEGGNDSSGKRWNGAEPVDEVIEGKYPTDTRLEDYEHPCQETGQMDPNSYVYNRAPFSSNINNMMNGGSNTGSILSQSGIGSNAVVDGNGYIVYLNQEDSTHFRHHATPFVPSHSQHNDTGELIVPASVPLYNRLPYGHCPDGMKENDARRDVMALPAQHLTSLETGGATHYSKLDNDNFPHQTSTTASGLKTPVSPVKDLKGALKKPAPAADGKPKKKVRRTLTFSSPVKQDETLTATENIANAMTSTQSEEGSSAGNSSKDYTTITSASLPSISSLLQPGTNNGISINIHVTNDINKDCTATTGHGGSEETIAMSRIHRSAFEPNKGNTVRVETMCSKPKEVHAAATPAVYCPIPRYGVEWHEDCQGPEEMERPQRYTEHVMPPPCNPGASTYRYPYRDLGSRRGYYTQQYPHPGMAAPIDRYYAPDYVNNWPDTYQDYPPEHYLSNYEVQHPTAISSAYQHNHWNPGWARNNVAFTDTYLKTPGIRTGQNMDMQDTPCHYYSNPMTHPRTEQPGVFEELYAQDRDCYNSVRELSTQPVATQYAKQRFITVPGSIADPRHSEGLYESSYKLHRPWVAPPICNPEGQELQGCVDVPPANDSRSHLVHHLEPGLQGPGQMESEDHNETKE